MRSSLLITHPVRRLRKRPRFFQTMMSLSKPKLDKFNTHIFEIMPPIHAVDLVFVHSQHTDIPLKQE